MKNNPYALSPLLPCIGAVTPSQVDTHGSTVVKIEGSNLFGDAAVTIGGTAATILAFDGTQAIWVSTPVLSAATGLDVVVTTSHGKSSGGKGLVEAWYPLQVSGARVYDSRRGVTGTTNASAWADQGSGAKTLSQGTAANQPAIVANAFAGSSVGLSFDGSNDVMTLAAKISVPTVMSRFAAVRWDTNITTGPLVCGDGTGAVCDFAVERTGSPSIGGLRTYDADSGVDHKTDYAGLDNGSPFCVGATHDGSAANLLKFRINGAPQPVQSDTFGSTRVNWDRVGAGGGNFFKGYLGAVVVTETIVSVSDQGKIENWLQAEFVNQTAIMSKISQKQYDPRDGAYLLNGPNPGELFIIAGWNNSWGAPSNIARVTNQILRSIDYGRTWFEIKPRNASQPANEPPPQHAVGFFEYDGYHYQAGGDGAFSNHRDIYRAPISAAGLTSQWEKVATGPWTIDCNGQFFVLGQRIWKVGGQTAWDTPATAHSHTYYSDDGGYTWTAGADAPAALAGGLIMNPLPVAMVDGKLQAIFVCGGGTSDLDGTTRTYRNSVIVFDGTTYTTKIADGSGPFSKRDYSRSVVFRGRVYLLNGTSGTSPYLNIADCWSAPLTDLVNSWRQEFHGVGQAVPWISSHADGVCCDYDRIYLGPGNGGIGDSIGTVWKIERAGVTESSTPAF